MEAPRRDNDRALSVGVVGLIGAFPQVQRGTIRNVTRAFSTSQYYFYSGERSPASYVCIVSIGEHRVSARKYSLTSLLVAVVIQTVPPSSRVLLPPYLRVHGHAFSPSPYRFAWHRRAPRLGANQPITNPRPTEPNIPRHLHTLFTPPAFSSYRITRLATYRSANIVRPLLIGFIFAAQTEERPNSLRPTTAQRRFYESDYCEFFYALI